MKTEWLPTFQVFYKGPWTIVRHWTALWLNSHQPSPCRLAAPLEPMSKNSCSNLLINSGTAPGPRDQSQDSSACLYLPQPRAKDQSQDSSTAFTCDSSRPRTKLRQLYLPLPCQHTESSLSVIVRLEILSGDRLHSDAVLSDSLTVAVRCAWRVLGDLCMFPLCHLTAAQKIKARACLVKK